MSSMECDVQASRQVSSMARHTPHNLIPSGRMLPRTPTSQIRAVPAQMTFQVGKDTDTLTRPCLSFAVKLIGVGCGVIDFRRD